MSDNQDSVTAKAITELQKKMLDFYKELQDLRVMSMATNLPMPGNCPAASCLKTMPATLTIAWVVCRENTVERARL